MTRKENKYLKTISRTIFTWGWNDIVAPVSVQTLILCLITYEHTMNSAISLPNRSLLSVPFWWSDTLSDD